MGEIAEMMLDGTMCQSCGEMLISLGDKPQGFPGYCVRCAPDDGYDDFIQSIGPEPRRDEPFHVRYHCKECARVFKSEQAARDHHRSKHGGPRP